MGGGSARVDDSLRDALMIKVIDLFAKQKVLQEDRAASLALGGPPPVVGVADTEDRPAGLEAVTVWPPISA